MPNLVNTLLLCDLVHMCIFPHDLVLPPINSTTICTGKCLFFKGLGKVQSVLLVPLTEVCLIFQFVLQET